MTKGYENNKTKYGYGRSGGGGDWVDGGVGSEYQGDGGDGEEDC